MLRAAVRQTIFDPPGVALNHDVMPRMKSYLDTVFFALVPPFGQQIGQGPGPRNLWPRLQVFHPPAFVLVFLVNGFFTT